MSALGVRDSDLVEAGIALRQNELTATGKNEAMMDEGPVSEE